MKNLCCILALICLLSLVSCSSAPVLPDLTSEIEASTPLSDNTEDWHDILNNTCDRMFPSDPFAMSAFHYDHCLFYLTQLDNGAKTIEKYDIRTNAISSACTDPGCTHKNKSCPLYNFNGIYISAVDNGMIYWVDKYSYDDKSVIFAYDMTTMKKSVVTEMSGKSSAAKCYVFENFIYYDDMALVEGGDKDNLDDYKRVLFEYDMLSKNKRILYRYNNNKSSSITTLLGDGTLYISEAENLNILDRTTGRTSFVLDYDLIDFNTIAMFYILDNKMYYRQKDGKLDSVYPGGKAYADLSITVAGKVHENKKLLPLSDGCYYGHVYCKDMKTGETEQLIDDLVNVTFPCTDRYLYYTTVNYRMLEGEHLYGSQSEWKGFKGPRAIHTGALKQYDLITHETKVICDSFNVEFSQAKIVGDYLFLTLDWLYDEKENRFDFDVKNCLLRVDLTNGEMKVMEDVQIKKRIH